MKTLKTTKEEIETLLNEEIDNLFLILQNKNNITSGDVSPLDSLLLDDKKSELVEVIYKILKFQLN